MSKYLESNHVLFGHFNKLLQSKNEETVANTIYSFGNLFYVGQWLCKAILKTSLMECIQSHLESDHQNTQIMRA